MPNYTVTIQTKVSDDDILKFIEYMESATIPDGTDTSTIFYSVSMTDNGIYFYTYVKEAHVIVEFKAVCNKIHPEFFRNIVLTKTKAIDLNL